MFQPSLNELIKIYEIKNEIKKEVINYYVIEKVKTTKMVRWFDNKEKALQDISEAYNYNKSELMEEYTFSKNIFLKDIIDFIKKFQTLIIYLLIIVRFLLKIFNSF